MTRLLGVLEARGTPAGNQALHLIAPSKLF